MSIAINILWISVISYLLIVVLYFIADIIYSVNKAIEHLRKFNYDIDSFKSLNGFHYKSEDFTYSFNSLIGFFENTGGTNRTKSNRLKHYLMFPKTLLKKVKEYFTPRYSEYEIFYKIDRYIENLIKNIALKFVKDEILVKDILE